MKIAEDIKSAKAQSGTVLVVVLLIVSIITGIAVSFASDFQLSLARAEQRLYTSQLKQYWFGIENFAIWGLKKDKEDDQQNYGSNAKYDHLQELWSTTSVEAPLDEGFASASMEDAQGRFNLNSLPGREPNYEASGTFAQRFTPQQRRFVRLLQTNEELGIDSTQAEQITEAVLDWMDGDNDVTGTGGAENSYYLGLEKPHRAANQLFMSVTELRLIRGVTPELYDYLLDLVVVLPDVEAGINVNTAKLAIMRSITSPLEEEPMSVEDGEVLVSGRPPSPNDNSEEGAFEAINANTDGFSKVSDFIADTNAATIYSTDPELLPTEQGLTTGSNYFLLNSEVQIAESVRNGYSLLKRDRDSNNQHRVMVIKRSTTDVL